MAGWALWRFLKKHGRSKPTKTATEPEPSIATEAATKPEPKIVTKPTTESNPENVSPIKPPTYDEAVRTAIPVQPAPGPAGSGRVFYDAPEKISIKFNFHSKPCLEWFGQMDVKCDDVPRLMREGFHWTTENIIREEGYTKRIVPTLADLGGPKRPCTVTRFWVLRDLQQPPRWIALLKVHAPSKNVLSGIRLENWTVDMVWRCEAFSVSGERVYCFDNPIDHYNSIYDDMPLEGWWPWPKKDSIDTKRD